MCMYIISYRSVCDIKVGMAGFHLNLLGTIASLWSVWTVNLRILRAEHDVCLCLRPLVFLFAACVSATSWQVFRTRLLPWSKDTPLWSGFTFTVRHRVRFRQSFGRKVNYCAKNSQRKPNWTIVSGCLPFTPGSFPSASQARSTKGLRHA